MKTIIKKTTLILLLFSILFIGNSCKEDEPTPEPCGGEEFLTYTVDNGSPVNLDAWTAKILIGQGADGDAYDIWDDDDFYLHSSSTEEGSYQYIVDYHTESGFALFIPGVIDPFNAATTDISITFTIEQTAENEGDCIKIHFSGTYVDANGVTHAISGDIQVQLDVLHQQA